VVENLSLIHNFLKKWLVWLCESNMIWIVFDLVDVLFGVWSLCRSTLLSYRVLFLRNNTKGFWRSPFTSISLKGLISWTSGWLDFRAWWQGIWFWSSFLLRVWSLYWSALLSSWVVICRNETWVSYLTLMVFCKLFVLISFQLTNHHCRT
jgi:hypothetical protein